jgi:hypothetical protein
MAKVYSEMDTLDQMHTRIGHCSYERIARMKAFDTGVPPKASDFVRFCAHCLIGKGTDQGYAKVGRVVAVQIGDHVSADVSTDWPVSINGFKHFLLIVDWKSNKFFGFLLRTRKEANQYLLWWLARARTHLGRAIKNLHVDAAQLPSRRTVPHTVPPWYTVLLQCMHRITRRNAGCVPRLT